ncbi:phage tail tape measure protein [Clostridioides difficile]|nr:phage tail tape measure protein [Clostridioides difficile]MCJ0380949.1 phage tail tape measure protein [Clostridioides difficile]MDB0376647.1 phage tail tape measure protein [Clostridioides difficile]MDB0394917.1 phage tail tape measure protein [Clostridioides difficile]HBE8721290.1 phage tail tape measure protein [Clostridioides difficile]
MAGSRIKGITVEIGGDTTKLQTALKGVNSSIKDTQSQLRDVEKLLKLDPGNTELLAQKQKLLSDAVKETKEKLETLKTAAEQANTALANGDISQEQYDALQREIIETENDLKKLETQANQSATAMQKIAASGEKLKTTGDNIASAGQKMLPVTAAVTGLGTAAVTTAASFESSMSQVQATMGITKDSMSNVDGQSVNTMKTLSELAKKMGSETAFSASECAQALNYLALAGYDTQEMCDTLPTVLNLAAAGDIELASASDMVTDAMSALGMETSEADTMVDQMAKTASSTNTSVAQLGEGILTIGATAKSIKGGTAELNTALGILANNGIKGAEGGTHLRNIILSLQNPTDAAAKQMTALGVSVYDSQGNMRSLNDILGDLNTSMEGMTSAEKSNIISTIFNKTDLSSVNALLANTGETWDSLQSSITNSAGAAGQMADTQLDNLQGQLTILKSALEGLAISFGELLMPAIKNIVGAVQKFVDWLNSMDEGTKKVIVTIALVVAAVGPVLIIIGKIISAVGTIMTVVPKLAGVINVVKGAFAALNTTMLANPIFLIIAAIAALVAAFIYLWNNCDGFRQFWINLWEGIKSVVSTVVEAIKNFFIGVIDFVKNNWQGLLLLLVNPFAGAFKLLYDNCEGFRNFIDGFLENVKNIISTAMETIKTVITTIWNAIKTAIDTVLTAIQTAFTTAWNAIKTAITTVVNAIKTVITTVWTAIQTTITTIVNAISTFLTTAWTAIQTTVTTIINAIKTVITTVWNAIKTTVSTVVNAIKTTISTVWNGIKNTITSIVNGIKTTVSNVFNNILSGIKTTVGNIASSIKSGFQTAISYITSLPSKALQWGKDIIMGIVNGIKSCISAVGDAVKSVADKITSFLHFSVPDEGPLTEYESWMPDFMQGLAKGINDSRSLIEKAVSGVASDMVINPNVTTADASGIAISRNSAGNADIISGIVTALKDTFGDANAQAGDIVIPVYLGNTMLDEIIVNAQQRTNLRSGGR